jgi:hypothetical protein
MIVAALHLDNWLFILLIGIAMLFRWLTSLASKSSRDSDDEPTSTSTPPTARPARTAPVESDQERIRKFLEALGQPAGTEPPPPVAHRTDIPPRPVAPIEPPRNMRPFSFPKERLSPEERRKNRDILHKTPATTAPVVEIRERTTPFQSAPIIQAPAEAYAIATEAKPEATRNETTLAALLRSPSGLRSAIILREVFGPPRAFTDLTV